MTSFLKTLTKSIYLNLLPEDLFIRDIPIARSRELFCQFVELVEIENHSYCNRVCWFCPNVHMDRRTVNHVMPDELFQAIIRDLASIDYDRTPVWSRYHEVLAHESIYERVSYTRKSEHYWC